MLEPQRVMFRAHQGLVVGNDAVVEAEQVQVRTDGGTAGLVAAHVLRVTNTGVEQQDHDCQHRYPPRRTSDSTHFIAPFSRHSSPHSNSRLARMLNLKLCVDFSDDRNRDCVRSGGTQAPARSFCGRRRLVSTTDPMPQRRLLLQLVSLVLLLSSASGCHFIYPGRDPGGPIPMVPEEIPRGLCTPTLPDYIIEPPDVLSIEAISLLPKEPYHLRALDVVSIVATGSPEVAAISGQYNIQPNGTIQLPFGEIVSDDVDRNPLRVVGRTVDEVQQTIAAILDKYYIASQVSVSIAELAAQQQIIGEHLVAPDGKVNLGTYGRVRLVGMTIEEARAALEAHLSEFLEDPQIALDVLGYNSKVYYV